MEKNGNTADNIKQAVAVLTEAVEKTGSLSLPGANGFRLEIAARTDPEDAAVYQNNGIDRIIFTDHTEDENEREAYLDRARELSRLIDISFYSGCFVKRFEDVKKAFYTGADAVLIRCRDLCGGTVLKEAADRFGKESVFVFSGNIAVSADRSVVILFPADYADASAENDLYEDLAECLKVIREAVPGDDDAKAVVKTVTAVTDTDASGIMELKHSLAQDGYMTDTFAPSISFDELKTGPEGLVPCIVQDHKNGEVLMMAYMNREAYERTVRTGVMTYYSRSRQSLWVKGETSGHYQYLRELKVDCDNDTLLAGVEQTGAACHTGNRSCFYRDVLKHEYRNKDISAVLRELYEVVCDRRINPKEGSYTNYLFNKGIDKILKKCGEEATEMVIAAKNPSHEELKYEIADLMYHMTVLMVECGVSWEEVAVELANR